MPILTVQDVDASVDYYVNKLGFKKEFSLAAPDGKLVFAFVEFHKMMIGLDPVMPEAASAPRGGAGVDLMLYLPEDASIDALYADVQARGTVIASPIENKYWGDRVFAVSDPDGYRLTFSKTVREVPMEEIEAAAGATVSP